MDQFIGNQRKFGVAITLDRTGEQIGKAHLGIAFRKDGPIDGETHIPGTWVDESMAGELAPDLKEFEMFEDHPLATPLERGVMTAAHIPEALRELEKIGPLTKEVHAVLAHIESGQLLSNKVDQLIVMFGDMLRDQHQLQEQQAEILRALASKTNR